MPSRYRSDTRLIGGKQYATARAAYAIHVAVKNNTIGIESRFFSQEGDRLDIIAGKRYNDSTLWWVIAAASGIGWGLQVPAGTVIIVPVLEQALGLV